MHLDSPPPARWTLRLLIVTAATRPIIHTAIRVALVVGTILNLINQGGRIADGLSISWLQMAMNYLVPYCVSSYSAALNQLRGKR